MGMLIKKGAVVDARIPDGTYAGYTPLFFAVRDGNISAVRALVDGGADVNARDKDLTTPLHTISWLGEDKVAEATECVRYLVSHGAEVGCRDKWGKAPVDRVKVEAIRKLFY